MRNPTAQKSAIHAARTLHINWGWVFVAAVLYGFGWHSGLQTGAHLLKAGVITLFMAGALGALIYWAKRGVYRSTLVIRWADAVPILLFAGISAAVAYWQGVFPMEPIADEQLHLATAHAWGHAALARGWVPQAWPPLLALWVTLLVGVGLLLGVLYVLRRVPLGVAIGVGVLAFLVMRMASHINGISGFQPPLFLLPGWLLGLLPPTVFRLGLLGMHAAMLGLLLRVGKLPLWVGMLVAAHPLYANNAVAYEPSLATLLACGLVGLRWLRAAGLQWTRDPRLWALLSLLAMYRHPAFLAWVPVVLLLVAHTLPSLRAGGRGLRSLVAWVRARMRDGGLLLPALGFVAATLLLGTPALEHSVYNPLPPNPRPGWLRAWDTLVQGDSLVAAVKHLGPLWVLLSLAGMGVLLFSRNTRPKAWVALLWFAALYYVFFAIRPVVVGHNRYQLEYLLPFVFPAFYMLPRLPKWGGLLVAVLLVGDAYLLGSRNSFPPNYSTLFAHSTRWQPVHLAPNIPYPLSAALSSLSATDWPVYVAEYTYGQLAFLQNRKAYTQQLAAYDSLHKDMQADIYAQMPDLLRRHFCTVLIAHANDRAGLRAALQDRGWQLTHTYPTPTGHPMYLLRRPACME